jgi:hypothetical protein
VTFRALQLDNERELTTTSYCQQAQIQQQVWERSTAVLACRILFSPTSIPPSAAAPW